MSTTLVTTCMDRNVYLEQSIPSWLSQSFKEIIILDWSSKELIKPIVDKYQNGNIILVRVNGKDFFNKSKAQNLVHRIVQLNISDNILSIDCDVILNSNFIELHPINNDIFYHGYNNSIYGTNLLSYDNFLLVNGYNELLDGWGYEDTEFYTRLRSHNIKQKTFISNSLKHIDHSDSLRTDNYKIKNKYFSNIVNKKKSINNSWDNLCIMESQEVLIYYPSGEMRNIKI